MPWSGSAFVGRGREMSAVEAALDRTAAGEALVLDLVGEPGIGKTRLMREALAAARRRGFETLEGHATEGERDLPYGVVAASFGRRPAPDEDRHHVAFAIAADLRTTAARAPVALAIDDVH